MILRNSFLNLMGLGLPILVAIAAIPALIAKLGLEAFGVLTIIWAVVSYFGLFDFGLGRAVTQQVAASIAARDMVRLRTIAGTSTIILGILGMAGALIMALSAPMLADGLGDPGNKAEILRAFYWMAFAMPSIVLTTGCRGALEAVGRFGVVNAIRLPMGIYTYGAPLVVVTWYSTGLDVIAAALAIGRTIAFVIHAIFAARALPTETRSWTFDRAAVSELLAIGGWISVSNIVSPIMSYVDRFIIAFLISTAAVALYATPQELVMRVGIIPTAVASVLFPLFAANKARGMDRESSEHILKYSLFIAALLLPFVIVMVLFAQPLLTWWISAQFAAEAAVALQLMAIAVLFSGVAQVPFSMLQGSGRADITAKIHIVELPIYLLLVFSLTAKYGINGTAFAWLARITLDMAAMYWFCLRTGRSQGEAAREAASR
ncbi:flippase [Altererythrobacter sp.]|nr:flippase [Altererythrobacter sp.]